MIIYGVLWNSRGIDWRSIDIGKSGMTCDRRGESMCFTVLIKETVVTEFWGTRCVIDVRSVC